LIARKRMATTMSTASTSAESGTNTPSTIISPPTSSPAPEQALNPAAAREVLARLREQVAAGDLDAADTLRHLGENCGTHFRAELKALRQHLDGFNFHEASQVVETLETLLHEI